MSYKKKNRYSKSISFFVLMGISFIILVISGISLRNTELITFATTGESSFEITAPGNYYVLLDTAGVRYKTSIETVGVTNNLFVYDKEETEIYKNALIFRGDNDNSSTLVTNTDFDKQIRYKGYLSFGKITLSKDDYTFNGVNVTANEDFGDYALLSTSYVARIGLLSFNAIITLLFGLLGFKYYREVGKIPISKYQKKHLK